MDDPTIDMDNLPNPFADSMASVRKLGQRAAEQAERLAWATLLYVEMDEET